MTDSVQHKITLKFTRAELEAINQGLFYMTEHYGPAPNPPTPAMTAQARVEAVLNKQ